MYKEGFLKVALIAPTIKVGKPKENIKIILKEIEKQNARLLVFPELVLSGYSCGDLFYQKELLDDALDALNQLLNKNYNKFIAIGMPLVLNSELYNVMVVVNKNKILGVIPKTTLANNSENNESRWFKGNELEDVLEIEVLKQKVNFGNLLFNDKDKDIKFGFEFNNNLKEVNSKGEELYLNGANLIINVSHELDYLGLDDLLKNNVLMKSYLYEGAYLHLGGNNGESTGEGVYNNLNLAYQNGRLLKELNDSFVVDLDFSEIEFLRRKENKQKNKQNNFKVVNISFLEEEHYSFDTKIEQLPFLSNYQFESVRKIQLQALKRRVEHLSNCPIVLGVSGGLDSTLALLVAYDLFKTSNLDLKQIVAVIMPSVHTSNKTLTNARNLAKILNVTTLEIDINDEVQNQLKMINHHSKEDITYENVQARIRTQTLMNLANKYKGIVLGTGNLSEIALGFMTYNGDQMSMYGINSGIPKTMVQRQIKEYISLYPELYEVLVEILNTPISPELKDNQFTEEIVGSYLLNDFLIYRHLACGDQKTKLEFLLNEVFEVAKNEATKLVDEFLKRFRNSQFKRQTVPEGPKVCKIALSPRDLYKMPGDV